ncbi:NAD(P)-dependent dehydrogenase (short-subunit alcohol dehydrogenase family) [Sphingobium wenxiniae]|uniref:Short-chain dehydrogenase n=2 Tax=Sphingobium TaxID=165695 RepID=T0GD43_9SPHN|nr:MULTISPECIES: SDR family oxidoreductase [Sphingobium]EQA98596.1 hypothetical protein L485_18090 [Sphingobium baderi LL03]KMS61749.1 2 4-dienoyl-CoA reductase [Sphingobium baderi LL03]MBB6193478.1 NAD(P)-dependent dehydrogenase (short-subunit alcohol dehydrogenase family) [Sphingobium wenxiniae]TWH91448.1 NAD(P)-dependent dehydrogenase (short-subunit alcohol dehydrogenase family) [Sphingobium wenxiniae]WRD75346.1 SDR family oxidoreductase [Sphingobium baderi]
MSRLPTTFLAHKRILITGGGSGLGQRMAIGMASLGAKMIICGRHMEKLQETVAQIEAAGGKCQAFECDIRQPEMIDGLLDQIWAEAPLDVLINNAAGNFLARTETLSPRAVEAVIRVSLLGGLWMTIAAGKRWIDKGQRGVVLSVLASGVGNGRPFTVPLTISKAAMLAMTKSLAQEWGPKGIRLVGLAPGLFPTPATAARLHPDVTDPEAELAKDIPLRRAGQTDDLVDLSSFLVSDAASYISGEMISIDGASGLTGPRADRMFEWTDAQWDTLRKG